MTPGRTISSRPILFTPENVRKILDGQKTQTRRTVRLPLRLSDGRELSVCPSGEYICYPPNGAGTYGEFTRVSMKRLAEVCPFGQVGDRLWVRETWRQGDGGSKYYLADELEHRDAGWKPSIYMPRWASRLTLAITEIRAERLLGISKEDCLAEGIPGDPRITITTAMVRAEYMHLWDSINAKRGHGWDTNPWVWAITFRRLK